MLPALELDPDNFQVLGSETTAQPWAELGWTSPYTSLEGLISTTTDVTAPRNPSGTIMQHEFLKSNYPVGGGGQWSASADQMQSWDICTFPSGCSKGYFSYHFKYSDGFVQPWGETKHTNMWHGGSGNSVIIATDFGTGIGYEPFPIEIYSSGMEVTTVYVGEVTGGENPEHVYSDENIIYDDTWYHVELVIDYDNNQLFLYVDDVLVVHYAIAGGTGGDMLAFAWSFVAGGGYGGDNMPYTTYMYVDELYFSYVA